MRNGAKPKASASGEPGVQRATAPLVEAIFGWRGNPTAGQGGGRLPSVALRRARQARWRMRAGRATRSTRSSARSCGQSSKRGTRKTAQGRGAHPPPPHDDRAVGPWRGRAYAGRDRADCDWATARWSHCSPSSTGRAGPMPNLIPRCLAPGTKAWRIGENLVGLEFGIPRLSREVSCPDERSKK